MRSGDEVAYLTARFWGRGGAFQGVEVWEEGGRGLRRTSKKFLRAIRGSILLWAVCGLSAASAVAGGGLPAVSEQARGGVDCLTKYNHGKHMRDPRRESTLMDVRHVLCTFPTKTNWRGGDAPNKVLSSLSHSAPRLQGPQGHGSCVPLHRCSGGYWCDSQSHVGGARLAGSVTSSRLRLRASLAGAAHWRAARGSRSTLKLRRC